MERSGTGMDKKEQKVIKETVEKLLQMLEIEGTFSIETKDDVASVVLETKDSGMVIGYHGDMLESLQLVFSFCVSKKIERFVRVSIEVGEYKKNRTDWLQTLTAQTKEQVLVEQKEISLPNLKSWERRIVHLLLEKDEEVVSESVGQGKDRTLVIKPR